MILEDGSGCTSAHVIKANTLFLFIVIKGMSFITSMSLLLRYILQGALHFIHTLKFYNGHSHNMLIQISEK